MSWKKSWKNLFFRVLTSCRFRRNQQQDPKRPRILIISTTALGDALFATPVVRAIKQSYPNCYLGLLTSRRGKEIFLNNPYIDDIFVNKDSALYTCIKWFLSVWKKKFDTALIFHTSQRAVVPLVCMTGPSVIVGFLGSTKGFDHLLTHPLKSQSIHLIEQRIKIAEAIGVKTDNYNMELFLTEQENQVALEILPDHPSLIGMQPGANNKFKRWDPQHFITLGQRLAKEKNAKIFIFGSKKEVELASFIAKNIPGAISLAGQISIRATAAIIKNLNLFITNDTGPMHIAFAMNTPTLGLFAPTDPKLGGPYRISHGTAIQKPRTCIPCIEKRCKLPFCMDQITPEIVWQYIKKV